MVVTTMLKLYLSVVYNLIILQCVYQSYVTIYFVLSKLAQKRWK